MNDKKIGIIAKTSVGDINIIRVLHLLIFASLSTDIIGCKFFILNIIFFLLFFGYDSKCMYSCTIVACLSSKVYSKHHLPTHYLLPEGLGLKYKSMVMCEQIRVLDKSRLIKKITKLDKRHMMHIDRRIKISLDLKQQHLHSRK